MLISDELFDAYLKCKTKAQLTFGLAGTDEPSHAISDWQRRLAENYEADCRNRLQAAEKETYLVGSPRPEDLRSAKYRLIIEPYIAAQGVESSIHAIKRGPAPVQKLHSPYTPMRFVPLEKISRHHKLMLAFDAFVLWKATGQMPTKGMIIHGVQHNTLGVKLDVWIQNVASLVAKLSALLTGETSPDPLLIKHCSECVFEAYCRKQVAEKDDLNLIDGLGRTERVKLNAKGIFTQQGKQDRQHHQVGYGSSVFSPNSPVFRRVRDIAATGKTNCKACHTFTGSTRAKEATPPPPPGNLLHGEGG